MGVCTSQKMEQKNTAIRLEDHIKNIDQNNIHDQALFILYNSRNHRAQHIYEPILSGFGRQFQKTQEVSQKSSV